MDTMHLLDSTATELLALRGQAGFGQAVFYALIADYLDNEIVTAFNRLLSNTFQWVTGIATLLMALWVWWQGWKIMTGQSQESMARFFATTAQRMFILGIALLGAIGSTDVFYWLANELPREVNYLVTGSDSLPAADIDKNLAYMQLALSSIDVLQTGGNEAVEDAKTRSMWMAALGTAGPAVVGGTMLLLNKIALGLFIGFGPLFVLMLIFDYTKPLFQKWLYYGLGTIFALVMLNLMIGIATEMITRVSAALWMGSFVSSLMGGGATEGITSRAMQQGGVGLILTMLIVTTPPMAAAFFNGVMGQFQTYSAFQGGVGAGARGPNSPPVAGAGTVNQDSVGQGAPGSTAPQGTFVTRPQDAGLGVRQYTPDSTVPAPSGGAQQAWTPTANTNPSAAASPLAPQPAYVPPMPANPPPPRGTGPQ